MGGALKKILYVDMDGVLADFDSGLARLSEETRREYRGKEEDIPGLYALMDPMPGALDAFRELAELFDVYILSTPPWGNPSGWSQKVEWVQKHLGEVAEKRLILTHHKNLNKGDFLVDDRLRHGVEEFEGEHLHFGTPAFPDWPAVVAYLKERR